MLGVWGVDSSTRLLSFMDCLVFWTMISSEYRTGSSVGGRGFYNDCGAVTRREGNLLQGMTSRPALSLSLAPGLSSLSSRREGRQYLHTFNPTVSLGLHVSR